MNQYLKHKTKWNKRDQLFLEVMKEYAPKADLSNKKFTRLGPLWAEIAKKVNLPAEYCQFKWYSIKYRYFILKNMIHIGRVTEQMVLDNPLTWRYLDGKLDFLDPYVFEIPIEKLTKRAHRFFNTAFGGNTSAHRESEVAPKKNIVNENCYMEVITDYQQELRNEPTCILPDIVIEDSDIEEVIDLEMCDSTTKKKIDQNNPIKEGKKEIKKNKTRKIKENCNKDEIKDYQQESRNEPTCILPDIDSDIEEVFDLETTEINKNKTREVEEICKIKVIKNYQRGSEPTSILPDIENGESHKEILALERNDSTSEKQIEIEKINPKKKSVRGGLRSKPVRRHCPLANFLIKHSDSAYEADQETNLKDYMNELAEILCTRVVPEKRQPFLDQVDLIVSEMLEKVE